SPAKYPLLLDLLAQSMHEPSACAVESGEQASPEVSAAPKPLARHSVVYRQVSIRGPVPEMDGQVRPKAPVFEWAPNTIGFDPGRKHEDQVRLLSALDHLISSPLL